MNREEFKGHWNEIKGKIKETFGKLTDDDLKRIEGNREQLVGAIQKRYGVAKEKAESDLLRFEDKLTHLLREGEVERPFRKTGTEDR